MQFKDIFELPIDRHMDGVIKPDAQDHLVDELKEYVFTPEIKRGLMQFCDEYNSPQRDGNGAWISGFYGSGKSHLLKMLSYLLENAPLDDGTRPLDYMKPKLKDDPALLGGLEAACERVPSESILFSAGAKADSTRRDDGSSLLFAFIKVLNERCGYFAGEQGFVAMLERDLDREGLYEEFKRRAPEVLGREWEKARSNPMFLAAKITRLYDQVTGQPEGTTANIIDHYRGVYNPTPDDFANWAREYIDKQEPGFRLNFFVDEMGQFIANSTELMFMLQQITELLNSKCDHRAWVIVVSQEDMTELVGKFEKNAANEFTKIQARFKVKMKIPPNDANTVVKERLLKKSDKALPAIDDLYDRENGNFKLLLDFPDGSRHYSTYSDAEEFEDTYPLVPYQFPMFHDALVGLAAHEAFTGEYVSTGARNMLAAARQVLRATKEAGTVEDGDLVSFDMMFEGLRGDLKGEIFNAIDVVNEHMQDPLAVRILKALLLVKYNEGFEATPKNIKVLLTKSLGDDPVALEKGIEESLLALWNAKYIQREGEKYMYLTNEEQDVEKEIGNEPVTDADVAKQVGKLLKEDVLDRVKVPYRNGNFSTSFSFNLSVDNYDIGASNNELSARVYTDLSGVEPGTQAYADMKELRVILGENKLLTAEVRSWLQTNAYVAKNLATATGRRAEIIARKKTANETRRDECIAMLRTMLDTAFYGTCMSDVTAEVRGQGADRVMSAAGIMVSKSYGLLACLSTPFDKNTVYKAATGSRLMEGESLPQYCDEVLLQVRHILNTSSRCVVGGSTGNSLEQCMKGGNYGWPPEAVRQAVGVLALNDKVECLRNDSPLEGANLATALSQNKNLDLVEVKVAANVDPRQVQALRDAYQEITAMAPDKTDAKGIAEGIAEHIASRANSFTQSVGAVAQFPFAQAYSDRLSELVQLSQRKRDWFIQNAPSQVDYVKAILGDLSSMAEFATGQPGKNFTDAKAFLGSSEANLALTDGVGDLLGELRTLLADEQCHSNSSAPRVKRIVRELGDKVDAAVTAAKSQAKADLTSFADQFRKGDYATADDAAKVQADALIEACAEGIDNGTQISVIRAAVQQFKDTSSARLYSIVAPKQPEPDPDRPGDPTPPTPKPQVKTVSYRTVAVPAAFANKTLSTVADVDAFVDALRSDLVTRIGNDEKIIL